MNPDTLCMGCMTDNGGQKNCPHCGFDENSSVSPLALPLRTQLNKKYVVGRVLGKPGGFGVTYLGLDIILDTQVAIKEFLPRELATRSRDAVTIP
jgi:serine/threonine protein kinase